MARRQLAEISIPGGGHPPVFQGNGKPYPLVGLPNMTLDIVRIAPITMRVGHTRTGRVILLLQYVGLKVLPDEDYFHLRTEIAIIADPTATVNPMIRPAIVVVIATFAGLKRVPASGLFITKASPILPKPTAIPAVIMAIPMIKTNSALTLDLPGVVKIGKVPHLSSLVESV